MWNPFKRRKPRKPVNRSELLPPATPTDHYTAEEWAAALRRHEREQAELKEGILRAGGARLHDRTDVATGYGLAVRSLEWDGFLRRARLEETPLPKHFERVWVFELTPKGRASQVMLVDDLPA